MVINDKDSNTDRPKKERGQIPRSSKSKSERTLTLPICLLELFHIDKNREKSRANRNMDKKCNFDEDLVDLIHPTKHNILIGNNVGKTSLAKYLLKYKCIIVEEFKDLKKFNHRIHSGIIFENIEFSQVSHIDLITLVSHQHRIISIDDSEIFVPDSTKLIFTTRMDRGMIFGDAHRRFYKKFKRININSPVYLEEDSSTDSGEYEIYRSHR